MKCIKCLSGSTEGILHYIKTLAGLPGFARDAYAPGIVAYFQRRYDFPHNSPPP